jgi:hypothetical protein
MAKSWFGGLMHKKSIQNWQKNNRHKPLPFHP